VFERVRHWRVGDRGPLGESVYGEQLNGAEKKSMSKQQRHIERTRWVRMGEGGHPRAHPGNHSGSPGAPPTGWSVAALRSKIVPWPIIILNLRSGMVATVAVLIICIGVAVFQKDIHTRPSDAIQSWVFRRPPQSSWRNPAERLLSLRPRSKH